MNLQDWQTANSHYLSTGLQWLRLRLVYLAPKEKDGGHSSPQGKISLAGRLFGHSPSTGSSSQTDIWEVPVNDRQISQVAQQMRELESIDPPPALVMLGRLLRLSQFESEVLLLCVGMELDTRVAGLCARAQDDPNKPYPTFALALTLFDEPAWEALSPDRPLRYWRLIEINQPAAQPLTASPLRADERIVNYIKGLNMLDDRLATFISPVDPTLLSDELPPTQQAFADEITRHWQRSMEGIRLPVAQLLGLDVLAKQAVAAHTSQALGRHLYWLPVESLPTQTTDLEILARLWQRESMLLPLALYLDAQEMDSAAIDIANALNRFLSRADGLIFLGARESWPHLGHASFSLDISKPTTREQQVAWKQALGGRLDGSVGQLTAQFDLNQTTITKVASETLDDAIEDNHQLLDALWTNCRTITRPRLDALAQRLDPKATWDDLVLSAEQTALLHQITDQVRQRHIVYETWGFADKMNRGLGISALFTGESGTGKTMAAEVMANELKLNLYRIDLSAVVSKYIGETEKNLRRLFDAAEDGGAILFFDEADALFGKRSEVKDSHDRYANIEINYLLQRMEAYGGLAILATNMKSALDQAFMRRLRFIVVSGAVSSSRDHGRRR